MKRQSSTSLIFIAAGSWLSAAIVTEQFLPGFGWQLVPKAILLWVMWRVSFLGWTAILRRFA